MKTFLWTLVHWRRTTLTFDVTLKFNRVRAVVEVHVCVKYRQAECSGSWVILLTNFCALSRNGEKSENPVLWPWPLTLKFYGFRAVVKRMFLQNFIELSAAEWVILSTEKKRRKQNSRSVINKYIHARLYYVSSTVVDGGTALQVTMIQLVLIHESRKQLDYMRTSHSSNAETARTISRRRLLA